jgi:hypothetical protein
MKVEEFLFPLFLFVSPCDKSTNQKTWNNHMKKCVKVNIDWVPLSHPYFGQVWGWSPTLGKVGIWSPPGLPNVQSSTARGKTPRIGVHWKGLEALISKMASHWSFGHL